MGELANGVREGLISEQDAVSIIIVLVGAAGESTSSLMGSAVRILAQDTELQQRLREQPTLIKRYVEEVVRLESPFRGHYRAVLRETQLGGVSIPTSARLFLLWAAANRDPTVFSEPDTLDLERHNTNEHLGFGHGIHFCIGARLARMETRVILGRAAATNKWLQFRQCDSRQAYIEYICTATARAALEVAALNDFGLRLNF